MAADAASSITPIERMGIEKELAQSRSIVEKLLQEPREAALAPSELKELSNVWDELWIAIDASVRPEIRDSLQRLSIANPN